MDNLPIMMDYPLYPGPFYPTTIRRYPVPEWTAVIQYPDGLFRHGLILIRSNSLLPEVILIANSQTKPGELPTNASFLTAHYFCILNKNIPDCLNLDGLNFRRICNHITAYGNH
jgi:hypothetical protein